jgi:uncharacterized lipoprotein YddW (UPF0748 family)
MKPNYLLRFAAAIIVASLSACDFAEFRSDPAPNRSGSGGATPGSIPAARTGAGGGVVEPVEPSDLLAGPPKIYPIAAKNPAGWDFGKTAADADKLVIFEISPERVRAAGNQGVLEVSVQGYHVTEAGGQNTIIPRHGFVVAGVGQAAAWMSENLKVGTIVKIQGDRLEAYPSFDEWVSRYTPYEASISERLNKARGSGQVEAEQMARADAQLRAARGDRALASGKTAKAVATFRNINTTPADAAQARAEEEEAFRLLGTAFARAEIAGAIAIPSPKQEARAAWRRIEAATPAQLRAKVEEIARAGFNVLIVEALYDGATIYPTASPFIFQREAFRGWDPMAVTVQAARERGMAVYAAVDAFKLGLPTQSRIPSSRPQWLALSRSGKAECALEDGAVFLSPSSEDARNWILGNIRELAFQYGLDGVLISSARYPSSTGLDDEYDYSAPARQAFAQQTGADPMALTPESNPDLWKKWREFRQERVASMIEDLRQEIRRSKPEMRLALVAYPPGDQADALGQNWAAWTGADGLDWALLVDADTQGDPAARLRAALTAAPAGFPVVPAIVEPNNIPTLQLAESIQAIRDAGAAGAGIVEYGQLLPRDIQALRLGAFRHKAQLPPGFAAAR